MYYTCVYEGTFFTSLYTIMLQYLMSETLHFANLRLIQVLCNVTLKFAICDSFCDLIAPLSVNTRVIYSASVLSFASREATTATLQPPSKKDTA